MKSVSSREEPGQWAINPPLAFGMEDVATKFGAEGSLVRHPRPRDFFPPQRFAPCLVHSGNPGNICSLNLAENRNRAFQGLENNFTVGYTHACVMLFFKGLTAFKKVASKGKKRAKILLRN